MNRRPLPGRAEWRDPVLGAMTYVVASGDHVKIGQSARPLRRMRRLQGGSVYPLELLAVMESVSEERAHEIWRPLWVRGEWFRREPEIEVWAYMFDESSKLARSCYGVKRARVAYPVLRYPRQLIEKVAVDDTAIRWDPWLEKHWEEASGGGS